MDATSNEQITVLARKSGTWLEWAEACRQLRRAGTPPQALFDATGFEVQLQERLLTAFQVYLSLVEGGADETLLTDIKQLGLQPLYELRVLNREERRSAAALVAQRRWSATQTRELAHAVRAFFRMASPPEAFERTAIDALAYRCWHLAREAATAADRATLVERGLAFNPSEGACRALEALLIRQRALPRLPFVVPDREEASPRVVSALTAPLAAADFEAVVTVDPHGPFGLVAVATPIVVFPGWLAVSLAIDPVAVILDAAELSGFELAGGEVLLLIDRAARDWESPGCYATDTEGRVHFDWIAAPTGSVLLGRVILALRPPDSSLVPLEPEDLWELEE